MRGHGESGAPVRILLSTELSVERFPSTNIHGNVCAGRTVAMVLGEVEDEAVTRDLHAAPRVGLLAMLPVEMRAGMNPTF